jgi:hypothetical protein
LFSPDVTVQLENMTVTLRPRSDWEAVDLGMRLAQRHTGIAWPIWALASAPWMLVLGVIAIGVGYPALAILAFWWLKPLFERPLLNVFSRVIFGDEPPRSDWTSIALKTPFTAGWFGAITWRRLELSRSFNLPVWQLEHLRGNARRARSNVLHLGTGATGFALTLIASFLVILATATITLLLVSITVREVVVFDIQDLGAFLEVVATRLESEGIGWDIFILAVYWLAEGLMAPFFVAAGFSLYLNRRTHLEAWDVELEFRRMAARRQNRAAAAIVMLAIGLSILPPPAAMAQTTEQLREERRSQIEQITSNAEFGKTETRTRWVPKNRKTEEEQKEIISNTELGFLARLFAVVSEVAIWLLVAAVVFAVYRSRHKWLPYFGGLARREAQAPTTTGGLLLSEEELPQDVPGTVRELWARGEHRGALSLLYRGALTVLNDAHQLRISDSDTEGECERRVLRKLEPESAGYFARIANTWQTLAYGHRSPEGKQVEALCDEWHLIQATPT